MSSQLRIAFSQVQTCTMTRGRTALLAVSLIVASLGAARAECEDSYLGRWHCDMAARLLAGPQVLSAAQPDASARSTRAAARCARLLDTSRPGLCSSSCLRLELTGLFLAVLLLLSNSSTATRLLACLCSDWWRQHSLEEVRH